MRLIVGLGNPGAKYEKTRHNIGFHFLDRRVEREQLGTRKFDAKYKAEMLTCTRDGEQLILCKPQTYMNLSGESVASIARFYKILPQHILVLHDEIDFVVARVALKLWGSAAGHNGLKSIIEKLWSRDFWRLRIGVDRPVVSAQVADRVLSSFKPDEKEKLDQKSDAIFGYIDEFLKS